MHLRYPMSSWLSHPSYKPKIKMPLIFLYNQNQRKNFLQRIFKIWFSLWWQSLSEASTNSTLAYKARLHAISRPTHPHKIGHLLKLVFENQSEDKYFHDPQISLNSYFSWSRISLSKWKTHTWCWNSLRLFLITTLISFVIFIFKNEKKNIYQCFLVFILCLDCHATDSSYTADYKTSFFNSILSQLQSKY